MNLLTRIRLGLSFTLLFSMSLGLVTAACSIGGCSVANLFIPMVSLIGLAISALIGLLLAPMGIWAAKTGRRNLIMFGIPIWGTFAAFIIFGLRRIDSLLKWEFGASLIVLLILGMIPNREEKWRKGDR
jgi:hypothetical protein